MKKLVIILVSVLLTLSLFGCKKDDDKIAELKVEIAVNETYENGQPIDVDVTYQNLKKDSKAWIAMIPLEIGNNSEKEIRKQNQWKYLIEITNCEVSFINPGVGEWIIVVYEDEDSGNILVKKSFKIVEKQSEENPKEDTEDPQQPEDPQDEEPRTISLVSDATKLVANIEDSVYVFYYYGNKITGIENYYAFSDSMTAKASVELIQQANLEDPEVDEVYAKENYVIVKYLPISYESLTRLDVLNIYSIDTSIIDYRSYFKELYGEDFLEFQIDLGDGSKETYYCKDGMTIYDFLDSAGNIDGFYLEDDVIYDYFGIGKIDYQDNGFIYAIVPDEVFTMSSAE